MMRKAERRTEYTLDIAKWRCGGDVWNVCKNSRYSTGEGETSLRNNEGYMCCLGQFAYQVVSEEDADPTEHYFPHELADAFLERYFPHQLAGALLKVYDPNFVTYNSGCGVNVSYFDDTKLAKDCADINDSKTTTVMEKVRKLSELLADEGITLLVKNAHLIPSENEEEEEEDDE
jgi:hypothetical protein